MENRTKDMPGDLKGLTREVRESVRGTADDLADKARAARDKAQEIYEIAQNKAVAGAKATDRAIRENPYRSIGVAFGVGILLGFLLKKK